MTWTDDHGEDGLRRKFDVYKSRHAEGSGAYPCYNLYWDANRIGADGEFIFVLRPETDEAAYTALAHYASEVSWRSPQLAKDIAKELHRIYVANDERTD